MPQFSSSFTTMSIGAGRCFPLPFTQHCRDLAEWDCDTFWEGFGNLRIILWKIHRDTVEISGADVLKNTWHVSAFIHRCVVEHLAQISIWCLQYARLNSSHNHFNHNYSRILLLFQRVQPKQTGFLQSKQPTGPTLCDLFGALNQTTPATTEENDSWRSGGSKHWRQHNATHTELSGGAVLWFER